MRIRQLAACVVSLPLRRAIKHASAERRESENLVVCCRLHDGTEGWGEGVPRPYVTGETCDGALKQLLATPLADPLHADCRHWDDVVALCNSINLAEIADDPRGCHGNALRCALELSILDAYGRLFREPVCNITNRVAPAISAQPMHEQVQYSGVITAQRQRHELLSALKIRLYGFAQCKVKVGVAGANDPRRLAALRRWLGRTIDLRVDANEAWETADAVARIEALMPYRISCVEQPVRHEDVDALADVRRRVNVPIMLDESLTSLVDARQAIEQRTCDLFNIRLSKCGGFVNSLRLAALAHAHGLGYQLGCHPGESAILSAAGRHWASSVQGIRYWEGSYDRHVLAERLTHEDMTFGYGGWAPRLTRPGLGVDIDPAALGRLARCQQIHVLEDT